MSETHFVDSPLSIELEAGLHKLCPCGLSRTMPFCDGAHKGTGFKSFKLELAEKTAVLLCRCGKTGTVPYCDGAHGKQPPSRQDGRCGHPDSEARPDPDRTGIDR